MEVLKRRVNPIGLRGRAPNTPSPDSLRERFQARQRQLVVEHDAAGHAVAVLNPADWVLAAVRDERTFEVVVQAYTRPVRD